MPQSASAVGGIDPLGFLEFELAQVSKELLEQRGLPLTNANLSSMKEAVVANPELGLASPTGNAIAAQITHQNQFRMSDYEGDDLPVPATAQDLLNNIPGIDDLQRSEAAVAQSGLPPSTAQPVAQPTASAALTQAVTTSPRQSPVPLSPVPQSPMPYVGQPLAGRPSPVPPFVPGDVTLADDVPIAPSDVTLADDVSNVGYGSEVLGDTTVEALLLAGLAASGGAALHHAIDQRFPPPPISGPISGAAPTEQPQPDIIHIPAKSKPKTKKKTGARNRIAPVATQNKRAAEEAAQARTTIDELSAQIDQAEEGDVVKKLADDSRKEPEQTKAQLKKRRREVYERLGRVRRGETPSQQNQAAKARATTDELESLDGLTQVEEELPSGKAANITPESAAKFNERSRSIAQGTRRAIESGARAIEGGADVGFSPQTRQTVEAISDASGLIVEAIVNDNGYEVVRIATPDGTTNTTILTDPRAGQSPRTITQRIVDLVPKLRNRENQLADTIANKLKRLRGSGNAEGLKTDSAKAAHEEKFRQAARGARRLF